MSIKNHTSVTSEEEKDMYLRLMKPIINKGARVKIKEEKQFIHIYITLKNNEKSS